MGCIIYGVPFSGDFTLRMHKVVIKIEINAELSLIGIPLPGQ
jgi:hypothetical protein